MIIAAKHAAVAVALHFIAIDDRLAGGDDSVHLKPVKYLIDGWIRAGEVECSVAVDCRDVPSRKPLTDIEKLDLTRVTDERSVIGLGLLPLSMALNEELWPAPDDARVDRNPG